MDTVRFCFLCFLARADLEFPDTVYNGAWKIIGAMHGTSGTWLAQYE